MAGSPSRPQRGPRPLRHRPAFTIACASVRLGASTAKRMHSPDLPHQYVERVVDLLDPTGNRITNMSVAEAVRRLNSERPEAIREIDGSFALIAKEGKRVRLARSLDRPLRYFLAKREAGPALILADRVDT